MKLRKFKKLILILSAMFGAIFMVSCGGPHLESHKEYASAAPCVPDSVTQAPCYLTTSGAVVGTQIQGDVTSWSNPTQSTTVTANLSKGFYDGKSCLLSDPNLTPGQILFGQTIFGVTGGYTGTFAGNILSQAYRNPGSVPVANHGDNQITSSVITLAQEISAYSGQSLPTTGGLAYIDIPDQAKDDDGYIGTSCKYTPRPTVNCGTVQSTIADRMADCLNLNGTCSDGVSTTKASCEAAVATWTTTATWDGSAQCNGGESTWKLVTRSAANKEVWQDQRTGLLWSSLVSTSSNWCRASGNTEAAPVTYYQSCNTTVAGHNDCTTSNTISGNGTIGSISGGTASIDQTIRVIFSNPPTNFTVVSSTGTGCTGGGAQVIGASAGSTKTYTNGNYCSFTITQGSTPFAANDKFFLKSTPASSYSCTPGAASTLQLVSPVSLCAEAVGLNPTGETWSNGGYMTAKGGMGKNSTPAVSWRLPTINDYRMAEVNGIRFVMPDMGLAGNQRPNLDSSTGSNSYEWSASVYSFNRNYSWVFVGSDGYVVNSYRNYADAVRCVGR